MRNSGCFAVLLIAGCSLPNPVFELAPVEVTVAVTSDATATQGPVTDPADTTSAAASDPSISGSSVDPSGVTTGTVEPVTSSGTSTGFGSSSGAASSTGEMQCALHVDPDFDEFLRANGKILDNCFGGPVYLHGKLLAGEQELRFNTSGTGCAAEENFGVFSLGQGYSLPVPEASACAKLYLYPDGPGPLCNIGKFVVIQAENQAALAIGSFTPMEGIIPPKELVTPSTQLLACCPLESQNCCMDSYGDFVLSVGGVPVAPGEVAQVPVEGGMANLANIQNWQTGDCQLQATLTRRDWAGVRLP